MSSQYNQPVNSYDHPSLYNQSYESNSNLTTICLTDTQRSFLLRTLTSDRITSLADKKTTAEKAVKTLADKIKELELFLNNRTIINRSSPKKPTVATNLNQEMKDEIEKLDNEVREHQILFSDAQETLNHILEDIRAAEAIISKLVPKES